MRERVFDPIGIRCEGGTHRKVVRVVCSEPGCNVSNDVAAGNGNVPMPNEQLLKIWHRRGWLISKHGPSGDLCPDCSGKSRRIHLPSSTADAPPSSKATAMPVQVVPPLAPPPPIEITGKIKREIIAALEEHWLDASNCYAGSMTDAKLAEKLNVRRIWIEEIRKEMFGDGIDSEEVLRIGKRLAELEAKLPALEKRATQCLEAFVGMKRDVEQCRKEFALATKRAA